MCRIAPVSLQGATNCGAAAADARAALSSQKATVLLNPLLLPDGASLTDLREALWWTLGGRVPVLAFGGMLGLLLRSHAALQWLQAR